MQLDPLYAAYAALRRHDLGEAHALATEVLRRDPADQLALALRLQCAVEDSWFDEAEFEQGALDALLDQTHLGDAAPDLGLATSCRPGGERLCSGYVRALTAAVGRPASRTSSRLGSARLQTARLQSASARAKTRGAQSRAGTALPLDGAAGIPEHYGGKPLFRRLLPNYCLRLRPSKLVEDDATPDPALALRYLRVYQEECGSDWFFNDRAARAYYLLRNYPEALRHLQAAARAQPREDTALKLLNCEVCLAQGEDRARVARTVARYRAAYQSSLRFALQAARVCALLDRPADALDAYLQALRISRGSEEAVAGAAALLQAGVGRTDPLRAQTAALQLARRLLCMRPWDPCAWNNVGVALMRQERFGEAFRCLLEAARRCRGQTSFSRERLAGIRSDVYLNLGTLWAETGDLGAAQDAFELSLHFNAQNAEACCGLGVLALRAGRPAKAAAAFRRGLEAAPDNAVLRRNLLAVQRVRGELEGDPEGATALGL